LFTFGEVFGGLRVAAVLDREKIRDVYQLFLVEILRRAHHRLMLIIAEIVLHVVHIYEIGAL
jgi:hypothetical protein